MWQATLLSRRVIGIGLAVALIPAVAAATLTFTTPWEIYFPGTSQRGGPPPEPTFTSVDGGDSTTVSVDMMSGLPGDRSYFELRREFEVSPFLQRVSLRHLFQSTLENRAAASVRVRIRPLRIRGQRTIQLVSPRFSGRGIVDVNHDSGDRQSALRPGMYRIEFRISYSAPSPDGAWVNSSPHTLTLAGL
jgi:hypothetical protein